MAERLIFHVDINSAFLSWEAARRVSLGQPDLRLIPSVVGGDPKSRTSIVVTKSIPAKKYGINTGEPVSMALRKCPDLVVVGSDFDLYVKCSKAFKSICKEYTAAMESFSIDEVFMDMSGMELLYPDPIEVAHTIKNRIRDELGFTANIGIGKTKVCAKMASDFEKPDKVHTLFPEEIPAKMWPLPVGDLFTCGKASATRLISIGIKTIGDLANANPEQVRLILGENQALHLMNFANGIDPSEVSEEWTDAKSYSAETTVEYDITNIDEIKHILLAQADVVSARVRCEDVKAKCVTVKYKTNDFKNHSHQKKLPEATDVTSVIYQSACQLIEEVYKCEPVRLVGLGLSDIDRDGYEQMSLMLDENKEKMKKLDLAMDSIRGKFGNDSIRRASTMDIDGRMNRKHKAQTSYQTTSHPQPGKSET